MKNAIKTNAKGRVYWGKGVPVNGMTLAPGAGLPKETLPAERIMVVMKSNEKVFCMIILQNRRL